MSEVDMIQNQNESEEKIYQRIENIIRTAKEGRGTKAQ